MMMVMMMMMEMILMKLVMYSDDDGDEDNNGGDDERDDCMMTVHPLRLKLRHCLNRTRPSSLIQSTPRPFTARCPYCNQGIADRAIPKLWYRADGVNRKVIP